MRLERRFWPWFALLLVVPLGVWLFALQSYGFTPSFSNFEEGFDDAESFESAPLTLDPYADWKRPEGTWSVALQVGHWHADEAPEEQINLRANTGATGGGVTETEVNLSIAKETKRLLEAEGVQVELLPTTIPPEYWADVFVSIHADGNLNTSVSGYKAAAPRRDRTGKAQTLADLLDKRYGEATGLPYDPNITRNMRGYYAFNWRRYEHSIHPMTVGAIMETGFLTSPSDRRVIVNQPERSARAIADAILEFLSREIPEGTPSPEPVVEQSLVE